MTFRKWLREYRNEDTPIGDIARDILADPGFPRGKVTETRIKAHMRAMNASDEALDCALAAFAEYQQHEANPSIATLMDRDDLATALLVALPAESKEMARHLTRLRSDFVVCLIGGPCEEFCDDDCGHERETVGEMTAFDLLLDLCLGIASADTVRKVLDAKNLIPGITGVVKASKQPAVH